MYSSPALQLTGQAIPSGIDESWGKEQRCRLAGGADVHHLVGKRLENALPEEAGTECPALPAEATGQALDGQGTGSRPAARPVPLEEQSKEAQLKLTNSTGPKVNPPGDNIRGAKVYLLTAFWSAYLDMVVPSRRETGSEERGGG